MMSYIFQEENNILVNNQQTHLRNIFYGLCQYIYAILKKMLCLTKLSQTNFKEEIDFLETATNSIISC